MSALILVALAVVLYALVSARLATTPVTGALLFMVLGVLLGPAAFGVIEGAEDRAGIEFLLEVALALVLFTDALGISSGNWRRKGRLPARLLLIGMPLTMILGWIVARPLFGGIDPWEAALIAICLAPTDAALGLAVVTDPRVPSPIRQALNIESGLNDGLALPFFLVALAAVVETETGAGPAPLEVFVESLVYAAVVGALVGWAGARGLRAARGRGWIGREWLQIATLALVVVAYGLADNLDGSGFIAAWVAGVAFGRTIGDMPEASVLAEDLGALLATVSFLGFGALLLGPRLDAIDGQTILYAVMSLTLVRIVPVALALVGTGLRVPSVLFAGWFGPRGLASIVFGLLVAEEALPGGDVVLDAVFVTVGLSVVLHGATAAWGAARYGAWYARTGPREAGVGEDLDVGDPTVRRRLRTQGSATGAA